MTPWSPWDGRDRGRLRVALALIAALDVLALWMFLVQGGWGPISHPAPWPPVRVFVGSAWAAVPAVVALLGYAAMAAGRSLSGGLVGLGGSFVLAEALAAQQGPGRGVFTSGACILGWLIGVAYARAARKPDEQPWGEAGAVATLAATYVAAALSKALLGGLHWIDPTNIQSFLLEHAGPDPGTLKAAVADLFVAHPALAAGAAVGTLLLEVGAVAMLVSARARGLVAGGLLAMHGGIFLSTGILYPGAMLCLLVLGLPGPWRGPIRREEPPDQPPSWPPLLRLAAVLTLLAVLAGLGGWRAYNRANPTCPWAPRPHPPVTWEPGPR